MSEVRVTKEFLISCIPHIAWGVFCSVNTQLPEWVDERPGSRIPVFFKLLQEQDERAIAFMDDAAASLIGSGNESDEETGQTWQTLMAAIRSETPHE